MGPVRNRQTPGCRSNSLLLGGLTILLAAEAGGAGVTAADGEPGTTPALLGYEISVLLSSSLRSSVPHLTSCDHAQAHYYADIAALFYSIV